jgi:hypothetical protein
MFAIEKSYVNMVLYEFVFVVNVIFKNQIQWLDEEDVIRLWHDSKILCGLPLIYGVINYN